MTISTRAELITAIGDYLSDDTLAARASTFIQLAEAMFNRRLVLRDGQGTATTTAAATVNVPSDFNGFISINVADYAPLEQLGPDDFQTRFAEDTNTGVPVYYMLLNGVVHLGPPPDSAYTVTMRYWQKLPALSDTVTTNWLLTAHPDLYLFASLLHAELYGWNDARLPMLKQAVDMTLAEILQADARARRSTLVGAVPAVYF